MRALVPLLLAVSPLALAGCGKTLDTGPLEKSIESSLENQGAKVARVTCPDDLEAKKGRSFTCVARLTAPKGQSIKLDVDQRDDSGAVEWTIATGSK